MINRFLVAALCLLMSFVANSQQIEMINFELAEKDVEARHKPVKDINGDFCALVKIRIPALQGLNVESGYLIGNPEYTPGEYKAYLCEGTSKITLKHPNYTPTVVNFGQRLKGKTTYILTLSLPSSQDNSCLVQFSSNINVGSLDIGGQHLSATDGRFNVKLTPGEYDYTLSTPSAGFQTLKGRITVTDEDVKNVVKEVARLNLSSDQKYTLYVSAPKGTEINIDDNKVKNWEKGQLLPAGLHEVKASLGDINKSFTVYLDGQDYTLDADLRNILKLAYPLNATVELTPKAGAMKPSLKNFKSGDEVRVSGNYTMKIKKSGYIDRVIEIEALPGNPEQYKEMFVNLECEADILYSGLKGKTDVNKALKKYKKMAEQGDDYANMALARHFDKDNPAADFSGVLSKSYLDKAALYGNPEANYIKGYKEGGFNDYLRKAMDMGHKEARLTWAGRIIGSNRLPDGRPAPREEIVKTTLQTLESVSNLPDAKLYKGYIYAFEYNDPVGIEYLEDLYMNPEWRAYAAAYLGNIYYSGVCCQKDKDKAIEYYEKSNPVALDGQGRLNMGIHYLIDDRNEVKADQYLYKLDLFLLDSGNVEKADLMRALGFYFYGDDATKRDFQKSYYYFDYAFKLGDRNPRTSLVLGELHREGKGGAPNDANKALSYLRISAEQNEPAAYRLMGLIYEKDNQKDVAISYYEKGAALGDLPCIGNIGNIFAGEKQYEKALKYWKEAARKGHKNSIRQLVKYYEWKKNSKERQYWKERL